MIPIQARGRDGGSLAPRPGGPPADRTGDRRVALASVLAAVTFLVAACLSLLLPEATRRGLWLPLHLALAGGAATAIAGVLPFFVAAFAAAPPADARLRAGAVAAVSLGALGIVGGVLSGTAPAALPSPLAAGGGLLLMAGIVLTGAASLRPVRGALGTSRGLVTRSYLVALAAVGVGASLATLLLAGWSPVVEAWGSIKPAHAWLNLFGFVSAVIATTLVHFFPTVVGARIGNHRSARLAIVGVAGGAWVTAAGFLAGLGPLAVAGGVGVLVGAVALVRYAARVWAERGRWTSDLAWHRFAIGGLASAIGWFVAGAAIAATETVVAAGAPSGWSLRDVAGPLVAGWVGLAVMAAGTHLVPAVGPGGPEAHAMQRRVLGRFATTRLWALDVGVAGLTLAGLLAAWTPDGATRLALVGVALVGSGAVTTLGLLVWAASIGLRARRPAPGRGATGP